MKDKIGIIAIFVLTFLTNLYLSRKSESATEVRIAFISQTIIATIGSILILLSQ
jgi:hypothetical protein